MLDGILGNFCEMYRWELWNAMNVLTNGIFFFMLKFVKIYTKLN